VLFALVGVVGCAQRLEGLVVDAAGAAVVGAHVVGGGCDAVTGPDGRFSVECESGPTDFMITHPAYLAATVPWAAGELKGSLTALPTDPGVYVVSGAGFVAPSDSPLTRSGDDLTGWKFCFAGKDSEAPTFASPLRMLDNHEVDWRLFAVDTEGCAYQLQHGNGEWWTSPSKGIPVTRESELAPGRDWLTVDLPVGDYAIVDWYAGSPVPDGAGWRARRLRVSAGGSAPPAQTEQGS
jgi:hypothetical protein